MEYPTGFGRLRSGFQSEEYDMGDHAHDEHEGPIHQAPWVMWVTLAICFGVCALILGVGFLTS